MRIELRDVSKGANGSALPATSTAFASGAVTLVEVETDRRPTVLGLIATGRMKPDTGRVVIDGRTVGGDRAAAKLLRASVALVDAPVVSEPAADVTLAGIVAEELMFAGRGSFPLAVTRFLESLGIGELSSHAMTDVPPLARLRALLELALLREGVTGLVLTSPDRHGGDPREWWPVVTGIAERGIAVLVLAGAATVALVGTEFPGTFTSDGPPEAGDEPERDDEPGTDDDARPEPESDGDTPPDTESHSAEQIGGTKS